ncbi:MAG: hypothetical protein GXO29_03120 [Thermotogae bacterium]|nr:hypothetical protein [Thermotogota bacterium]
MLSILTVAFGGFGYWMGGYARLPLGELRTLLQEAGYPVPDEASYLSGGEGYAVMGRALIGGGGFGLQAFASTSADYNTFAEVDGGYFSLGYALLHRANYMLYPSLGVGGGNLKIKVKGTKSGNLADVLKDPPLYAEISVGGPLIKGGLTFVYRYLSLIVGFSLGAAYLKPVSWKLNDNPITGYPSDDYLLLWAGFTVGGGWWSYRGRRSD